MKKGKDGKYNWNYEVSLYKNPTILFLVWKIFFWIIIGICIFSSILTLMDGIYGWKGVLENIKFFFIFLIIMEVLCTIGYLIYALMMGGKYKVHFEMDEKGILHEQEKMQAEKAKKIGLATAIVGVMAKKPSTVGAGLNSTRTSMYSDFEKVKKVKAYPNRNLIKVNEPFSKNQVYVKKEDFDFVYQYIKEHCKNTK